MTDWVKTNRPARVLLVTECSMASNIAGRGARHRLHQAVQPLPAHEADHAAEDPRQPRLPQGRGHGRSDDRGEGAPRRRAHGQPEELRLASVARIAFRRKPDHGPQVSRSGRDRRRRDVRLRRDDEVTVGQGERHMLDKAPNLCRRRCRHRRRRPCRPLLRAPPGAAPGDHPRRRADRRGRFLGLGAGRHRRRHGGGRLGRYARRRHRSPPAPAPSTRRSPA